MIANLPCRACRAIVTRHTCYLFFFELVLGCLLKSPSHITLVQRYPDREEYSITPWHQLFFFFTFLRARR